MVTYDPETGILTIPHNDKNAAAIRNIVADVDGCFVKFNNSDVHINLSSLKTYVALTRNAKTDDNCG